MFRALFIIWCLSWPVSVVTAMQEPFATPQSRVATIARAVAAANMLAFYICGAAWLIHRTRKALAASTSPAPGVFAAWAAFVFFSPFGPVVLLLSRRMLRGSNAIT
jgi:hypothetical protein